MSVLPFLAVAIAGAVIATLLRDLRRLGTLVGLGSVAVALAAAALVKPEAPLAIGGGALAGSAHLRLVLTLCLAGGLLVLMVARLATWQPSGPGTLLGGAAGIALALGLAGTPPALLGAAAATIAASALALGSLAAPSRVRALARELRGAITSVVIGLVAAAILPGGTATAASGVTGVEPAAAALVLVGMALVVAHRFGAIPLHARVSRLADATPSGALPILAAWIPAAWGLVILGWAQGALGPASAGLGLERGLIVALALVTLLLGTLAALIQDEVEHVVAYTIVADAGVALLALASLDPAARDAARAWVLIFATTRTALIGWTIAFRAAFGTGRLRDTAGWLRRAPALGVALAAILVAAVGWPGLLAWDARLSIVAAATSGPVLFLAFAGSLGTGAAVVRLLVVGAGRPSAIVAGALGELPRLPAPRAPGAVAPPTGRAASTMRAGRTATRATTATRAMRAGDATRVGNRAATGGVGQAADAAATSRAAQPAGDAPTSGGARAGGAAAARAGGAAAARAGGAAAARAGGSIVRLAGRLRALAATVARDARPALELNRVPLRAFAVILLAGLALVSAAGGFGIEAAAQAPGPVLPSPSPIVGG